MNIIWPVMIIVSLLFGLANGSLAETTDAGIAAAGGSITAVLSFAGIMCLWSGLMRLCDRCGISRLIERLLNPIIHMFFPRLTDSIARKAITMNMTANILGMGNAATPMGITAMERLDELGGRNTAPSDEMCMLVVLNTASFQLIPTTVLALRAAAGSHNPSEIMIPVWIASLASITACTLAVRLYCRIRRRI